MISPRALVVAAVVAVGTIAASGQGLLDRPAPGGLLDRPAPGGTSQPPSRDPIKIGFLAPLSGPYVQNGRDILNGFLLALDEIGYRAGGRRVEVIIEDDEAIPAVGLTKARKLIERDKVHMMAGTLLSSTGYALAPYIDAMRVPMVYPVVSADDLTQRRRSKWIVRTGWTASQPNHAFGEYAYRELKVRKVATIALDYAFGWESVGGFERTFEAEGGTIVQKIWCPVSVHDFAPYLAQVSQGRRRGVRAGPRPRRAPVHAAVPGVRAEAAHAADRRRHDHRRARAAVHGRRGARRHHRASLQRRAGHAGEPEVCGGVPRALQESAELLLGEHVQRREVVRRRGRGGPRPRRGLGGVSRRVPAGQGHGFAARTGAARTSTAARSRTCTSGRSSG